MPEAHAEAAFSRHFTFLIESRSLAAATELADSPSAQFFRPVLAQLGSQQQLCSISWS